MRDSVKAAWPEFCERWEGRLSWMYLDTKGLVTTGTGNLIDSVTSAQQLPWYFKNGRRATLDEVETEWKRVKKLTSLMKKSGWAYEASAKLFLDEKTIDELLFGKTEQFWNRLAKTVTDLDKAPADAQLALLDLSWQNGPAFLDSKSNGKYVWANMRPAALEGDWERAARAVPGTGARALIRSRLFNNAAQAIKVKADLDVLWNSSTPSPSKTPEPTPEPDSTPKGNPLMATSAKNVYKRSNVKDQVFEAGLATLKINNDNGDTSVVVGPNAGVAVTAGAVITSEQGGVLRFALFDYAKGQDTVLTHKRIGQSFPPGARVEVLTAYNGAIGKAKLDGHTLRLRVVVESQGPFTVHDLQTTGYTL